VLFLSGVSAAPVWTFAIIILKSMGGTVRHIGYSSFTSALIQVPIVFFAGSFRRFRPEFRIFLGMLMYIIYIFGDSLTSSPDVFVILSGISGLGFGLLLPAMREYVFRIMPGKLATTAQGVCDAMNGCLGMLAGNLLFSLMYGAVSIPAILRIDAAILAAGLAVFTINALIMDRRERRCCEAAPCERAQR
jgi:MFS family permease